MRRFCVHGIVRGGQVILDIPLDLPDGTVVTVTDRDPDDVVTVGPTSPPSPEVVKRMILNLLKRPDLMDDPDWRAKIGAGRAAVPEELIERISGMWAHRPEMADPEEWVRRLRGNRE
jgi:hypothetical protein